MKTIYFGTDHAEEKHTIFVFIDASNLWAAQKAKGNMDVEITIDALHHASKYDTAIFFTGDSDFLALVKYLRVGGKKVFIFSSKNNISHELKTGSDGYFDVLNLGEDVWGKKIKHRPKKT